MLRHNEASIAQCRLNILAVLAYHQFPTDFQFRILTCQTDRIIVEPGEKATKHLGGIIPKVFRETNLNRKLHGPTASWTLRECVPFASLQITGHYSPARILFDDGTLPSSRYLTQRDKEDVRTWELDIDHANPEYAACQGGHQDLAGIFTGLATTIVHGCEVAYPGKTDPYWIRKRLLARGVEVPLVTVTQAV